MQTAVVADTTLAALIFFLNSGPQTTDHLKDF